MWLQLTPAGWQERPAPQRGELFGDGVFETLHIVNGRVLWAAEHARRLRQAAQALQLELPAPVEAVMETLAQLAGPFPRARAKILLQRTGEGPYTPTTALASYSLYVGPLPTESPFPLGKPQRLVRYPVQFLTHTPWSAYKTLSALGYVQAAHYAQQQRCDDALLLSAEGYLAETSRANIFFWDGQKLYTPALRTGCVAGILRQVVLRVARQLGLPTEEGLYPLSALQQAQELFTTNVIQGLCPVIGLHGEGLTFRTGPGTITHTIAQALKT